ncbi:SDR family oxidoreductase [Legionella taurinensis]|uniref:SDR family oxidoreductase n=1 Tax=Legionella taurinensis TaxID=70611 RepID=A0A3A5LAQ7_9GAMM|nr:SDR family oxidoreductase [Legionella taurinensis]RJT66581.1 SDR family oxidoreductase [Legionella taurinensis]
MNTRAASGLTDFDKLVDKAIIEAPLHQLVTIEDIGKVVSFLVSDKAASITRQIL